MLSRKHLAKKVQLTGQTGSQLLRRYQRLATRVTARALQSALSRDPDDDHVIACALAANADLVVTGDDDLLSLKRHQGIDIVTPAEALRRLAEA